MDPAQEVENQLLALQKPMNDVIDRGDSAIQQFYSDSTVFVTGGSGFIGKQLIEKLFRSCKIKKLYMLLRPRKRQNIQERLQAILRDPVYESLYKKQPQFAERIVPVEGDVADIRLGLTDNDWDMLANEVNIIFHMAATVKFDEPIKMATLINVRGTREALSLARDCKSFKCFNHISTAFAHTTISRINTDIEEMFYPSPVPPDVMIKMVETVDEGKLNAITADLIEGWPNTYTFTKAIAEELIRNTTDLPVCVVKPPIVIPAYMEPSPGWIDFKSCLSSSMGAILAIGLGIVHLLLVKLEVATYYSPVDYVNNTIIAASWDSTERRKNDGQTTVYTIGAKEYAMPFKTLTTVLRSEELTRLSSPTSIWYMCCIETSSVWLYWILTWLFHYIPGYFVDTLLDITGARPKGIPRLVKVYAKVYNLSVAYKYFTFNFWNLKDNNCQAMMQRMSPEDRAIFDCDMRHVDHTMLLKAWCIGVRKYVVKDGLQGSVKAYNRQKHLFKYIHYIFSALYIYLIYTALYLIYSLFKFIVQSVC